MNNEFSCITAVSVGTRGIWLCPVKQQEQGSRKDPRHPVWSGGAQKTEEQLETELPRTGSPQLSPLFCPFAEDFPQIELVALLQPRTEGRSTVVARVVVLVFACCACP